MRTLSLSIAVALAACGTPTAEPEPETPVAADAEAPSPPAEAPAPAAEPPPHAELFRPLPAPTPKDPTIDPAIDEARVALGKALYFDGRLSVNDEISCNSCHRLDRFGVDGEPTSPGHDGTRGGRNSPTTLNAALHIAQFWDGRAPDVEAQAKGPILNPIEMGMPDEETVVAKLKGIEGYGPMFAAAFPGEEDPITYDHLADAIGAFERRLITPGRFDAYLEGDVAALTEAERAGLDQFVETGCTMCHSGPTVGGTMYMKLGLAEPYETEDVGRMAVTGNEADRHVFKVPSLRNVAETGPYFHDGSVATLEEAVALMARHQLGKQLTDEEIASIVTFLKALTGEIPEGLATPPELPS